MQLPWSHGDCRASALQELCAPRYLKLLKANHPALHTLHVPAVFHAEFGDDEADQALGLAIWQWESIGEIDRAEMLAGEMSIQPPR